MALAQESQGETFLAGFDVDCGVGMAAAGKWLYRRVKWQLNGVAVDGLRRESNHPGASRHPSLSKEGKRPRPAPVLSPPWLRRGGPARGRGGSLPQRPAEMVVENVEQLLLVALRQAEERAGGDVQVRVAELVGGSIY